MRRYLWMATFLFVTLAAVLVAQLTKTYLVAKMTAPLAAAPAQTAKSAEVLTAKVPLQQYEAVNKRNIFNANPPPKTPPQAVVAPPPEPPPQEIPVQPLQIKLVGAVARGTGTSFVILEDKGGGGGQAVYQVGDMVQQARIVDILPDCVVLERNRQRDKVCFEVEGAGGKAAGKQSNAAGTGVPQPAAAAPAAGPQLAAKDDVLRVDSSTWQVRRDLVLEQFANFGSLSEQAQAVPYAAQGQQQGFRLTKLKAGSLLQQVGLQDGDILRKINDLELRSPQEALQAYQHLQSAKTLRLEILRRNQPTTLTYELR